MKARGGKTVRQIEPRMRVQYVPGVGPRRAAQLERMGVGTVYDLLYLLPRRYLDASRVGRIADLAEAAGEATLVGRIVSVRLLRGRGGREAGLEAVLDDGSGRIPLSFFGRSFLKNVMEKGQRWIVYGRPKQYRRRLYFDPQEYERLDRAPGEGEDRGREGRAGGIIPVYPLTEGLSQNILRNITDSALGAADSLQETLPGPLRESAGLMGRAAAVRAVHRPARIEEAVQGRRALAFDELFYMQLMLLGRKLHIGRETRKRAYRKHNNLLEALARSLPFTLTRAQKKVVREIDNDLTGAHPLNRLVQGDVGSGKTVVALIAALRALENGYQAAVMAPTEVLAEQHCRTLGQLLAPLGIEPVLLTGSMAAPAKREARELIASGEAGIAVGTHALIQESVRFRELGLAVIDEQHCFGVNQRLTLRTKSEHTDCLVMTATPIPRSLALTLYGDLDVSVIDELPAGRKPVSTHIVPRGKRQDMERFIGERLRAGEQAYVVCPRIEEDEEGELASALEHWERYRDRVFPDENVVLLHGRMKPADKERAMKAFEGGEARVLVGTTVIEVGIDVAAATVMLIESAERFGLSQLHQLRGRVGRGERPSWCFLVPSADAGPDSLQRLEILAGSTDGFEISEEDLRLRGPGDFFGERQSGLPELRVADLVADMPVLLEARRVAEKVLERDPLLKKPENEVLRRELILRYRGRVDFLRVG